MLRRSALPDGGEGGRGLALGLVLLGSVVAWRVRSPALVVDDAWISFRIARNLAEHGRLSYEITGPAVEGMTNLSWTLLSAAALWGWPGLDPVTPARLLGLLCHLGSIGLITRVAWRESAVRGGEPRWAALVAGGLLALSTTAANCALSGLETGLWQFLFVCALERAAVACREERLAPAVGGGLWLGAMAWTRPEGVLLGALVAGAFLLRRRLWRRGIALGAAFAIAVAGLIAFRFSVYGTLVPNTFHAKPPDPAQGLRYLQSYWIHGLGLIGPLAAVAAVRQGGAAAGLAFVIGVMGAGTVWSGGDWMTGFRRFTEVSVGLGLLMGLGVSIATGPWKRISAAAIAAMAIAEIHTGIDLVDREFDHELMARLGDRAQAQPGVSSVALVDIGVFGWHFRGRILDLAGLVDEHIGRLPGGHLAKQWDEAYFRQQAPDLVLVLAGGSWDPPLDEDFRVRPVEVGLVRSLVDHGGYTYYRPYEFDAGKRELLFVRDGLQLDPRLWGPRDSRDVLGELRAFRDRRRAGSALP